MKRTFSFIVLLAVVCSSAYAGVAFTSAKIYRKQGDFAKAMEFYDQAAMEESDNIDVFFDRGELLGMIAMEPANIGLRKKLAGEATRFQQAVLRYLVVDDPLLIDEKSQMDLIAKYPNETDTTDYRKRVLVRMLDDFDVVRSKPEDKKAKKLIKKIDEINQGYWWEFYSLAVDADSIYRAKNEAGTTEGIETDVNNGLDAASVAIMLDPGNWSSRYVYAQLKGYQEKDDSFVEAWQNALSALDNSDLKSKEKENFESNRRYGNLQLIQYYYSHEDFTNTLRIADKMLADEPGLVEAVQYKAYSLATMASDESRPEAERDSLKHVALDALVNAKDSNPGDENIIYYIGQFNLQLNDTTAALAAFDEYLGKVPDDGVVLAIQGVIYLESEKFGDLNKAIEKLRAAKDAEPENAAFWTNYGIALIRNGQNEEGKTAMEKGSELSGN